MKWSLLDFFVTQYSRIPPLPACDLTEQTVVVVGANTGLGLETAKHLARMGPTKLILGCRDYKKAVEAQRIIRATTGFERCELGSIDLADFSSVVKFVDTLSNERLDILVCNAAVFTTMYETTGDGWEKSLQVNYLSSALLVILLLPIMLTTARKHQNFPRIVVVGSESHYMASLPLPKDDRGILGTLNNPSFCTKPGAMMQRYAVSKLLSYFLVKSLTARLSPSSPLSLTMPIPGFCRTSLFRSFPILISWFVALASLFLARSIEKGARVVAWTAIAGHDDALERERMRGGIVDNVTTRRWEESDFVLSLEGQICERALWNETVDILSRVDERVGRIVQTLTSG